MIALQKIAKMCSKRLDCFTLPSEIYENYFANNTNQIQNFILEDGIVSVGIHSNDFDKKIRKEFVSNYEKQK